MSDRTWHPILGRRRPYFLAGAILSSLALILMPNSSSLWMAAGLLWILDSSINISMEPFRAFVADKLPIEQRTFGFSMQSLFIGLGSVIASALPWIFSNWVGIKDGAEHTGIPTNVKWSFYIGAAAFFLFVLYTILTSKEYPPQEITNKEKVKESNKGFGAGAGEILDAIVNMPKKMKQLALVQFLTWPGLFLMWFYYTPAVGADVFGGNAAKEATAAAKELYKQGTEWAGITYSFQNLMTFCFALLIPVIASRIGKKTTHMLCLFAGGIGLLSIFMIHGIENKMLLIAVMCGVGIAWSSILSMPYSMLSDCLPAEKIGVYMGIFNFFIVLPEIIASLGFGWVMEHVLHNNRILAVQTGGCMMILAGLVCYFIVNEKD
jgi:maltose/moltooligosaccharide transporter